MNRQAQMQRTRRILLALGAFCASCFAVSCASKNAQNENLAQSTDSASAEPAEKTVVVAIPDEPDVVVGPVAEETAAPEPQPAAVVETPPVNPAIRPNDGRPDWWLREPQFIEGRLTICAEALGADILQARRNAVEKGLAILRQRLGGEPASEDVVILTVRPLPIPADTPNGARFAGYVMVSGLLEEDDG